MSRKKLMVLGCIGVLAVGNVLPVEAASMVSVYSAGETVAVPMDTQYVWKMKVENGKKYTRLWDMVNARWVTDWIPC